MKKTYEKPTIEIVEIETGDILTTSGYGDGDGTDIPYSDLT